MIRTIGLVLLVVWVAMAAPATTPITATITSTTSDVTGQATVLSQQTGTFSRASDGRELRVMLDSKTNQPGTAILRTANNEDVVMKYADKQYTVNKRQPVALPEILFLAKPGMESQTINGVFAIATPMYDGNTPGKKLIGKSWYSPQYKIEVRSEFETVAPTGKTIRRVTEMSNIQIGTEPDLSQFVVPADFSPAAETARCSVCSK